MIHFMIRFVLLASLFVMIIISAMFAFYSWVLKDYMDDIPFE